MLILQTWRDMTWRDMPDMRDAIAWHELNDACECDMRMIWKDLIVMSDRPDSLADPLT